MTKTSKFVVLGVDPGPKESAYAVIDREYNVLKAGKVENEALILSLQVANIANSVAIESIQSYGMVVGRSVFETCYMIGRIMQTLENIKIPYSLYPRPEYTRRICGVGKVNDSVLRRSLLTRFGGDKKGEPMHCLRGSDLRSAFAVGVYHIDVLRYGAGVL